jgi:uncharacterized repeat protein (TIGR01451 family)
MLGRNKQFAMTVLLLSMIVYGPSAFAVDFASPVSHSTGMLPYDIVAADFNGDGKVDLAVANSGGANISILLGKGDGTFESAVNYDAGAPNPAFLAKGDFDNDGKTDLAAQNSTGIVSILLGKGDGSFQAPKALTGTFGPIVVADFNLDGLSDLAFVGTDPATNVSAINILLGNGDGSFQPPAQTSASPGSLVTADFNHDGKPDLAVSRGSISIFLGQGDGSFLPGPSLTVQEITSAKSTLVSAVVPSDINNDGLSDVVVSADGWNAVCTSGVCVPAITDEKISCFLQNNDGSFQSERIIAQSRLFITSSKFATLRGNRFSGLLVGDVNGDDVPDVAYRNSYSNGSQGSVSLETRLGRGDGTFSPAIPVSVDPGTLIRVGGTLAKMADLNGDQLSDVVAFGSTDDITVLLNTSPASGADLSIVHASASPESVGIGMNLTYSIDALNEGPQDASEVMLADQLAGGTSFVSATPSQGSCSHANRIVTCNFGSLASAFDATVSVVVTPTATGTITNSVSVLGAQQDLAPANNSITQNTTVVPVFTLTAAIAGAGSGTVTSDLGGINCPGLCSTSLAMGTSVSLTATAASGFTFSGWSGACSGSDVCTLTMDTNRNVTATFVPTPDFSLSADVASPASVVAGHSATSTVTINSANGFNSAVQFTCSVAPMPAFGPTCSLNPASATPAANGSVTATLTVATAAPTVALLAPSTLGWLYAIWLPVTGLAWVGVGISSAKSRSRKKLFAGLVVCIVLVLGTGLQVACGGKSEPHMIGGTPAGTYTVTVTGTSGAAQHSTTVRLTVN